MLAVKDINTALVTGSYTNEELNAIVDAVKFARSKLVRLATVTIKSGQMVKFTSTKLGRTVTGQVIKVNRKFIIVKEGTVQWRVPGSMLTVA